jgi:hypothetical protein
MKYIGIDPDLHKNGMAIIENGEFTRLTVISFPCLCELFESHVMDPEVLFFIEDVNKHKPTFYRGKMSPSVMNNISQKVGMVKGVGTKIIEMLQHYHCNYVLVAPIKGLLKKTKDDRLLFEKLTGWKGKSNADNRDAAMLIYKYRNRC